MLQPAFQVPLLPADGILDALLPLVSQAFGPLFCGCDTELLCSLKLPLDLLYIGLVVAFCHAQHGQSRSASYDVVTNVVVTFRNEGKRETL